MRGGAAAAGSTSEEGELEFWWYVGSAAALVCVAGLMSGLTLALMSVDVMDLEILLRSGTVQQRAHAHAILPLLTDPHRLLVSLLICNSAASEALPLVLDRVVDPVTAVLLAVTVVLVFGEIVPQAVCATHGLRIAAASAPCVRAVMLLTWPLAAPIAAVLNAVLGPRHSALFRRAELKALVDLHGAGQAYGGHLTGDEVAVIKGALDLSHKTAAHAMTPIDLAFMLPADARVDEDTTDVVVASGHSRIPVHAPRNRGDIRGILLVKELIQVAPDGTRSVGDLKIRSVPYLLACECCGCLGGLGGKRERGEMADGMVVYSVVCWVCVWGERGVRKRSSS